jgi:D-glycero-D-manno-heptose 1,7-bisphosphate phosphatase
VLIDRDGTIIEDKGYIDDLGLVSFFPWSIDTIRALNHAGLPVVLVTNQSGIARGKITAAFVEQTHRLIADRLAAGGARIDAYYYCPHHRDGIVAELARACDCRKPGRAMADQAARDLNLDLARSFVVGDKWLDIGLARAVGARGILVRTGYGADEEGRPQPGMTADIVVDNLAAAASWILGNPQSAIRNP